jgi:hypothetical protein
MVLCAKCPCLGKDQLQTTEQPASWYGFQDEAALTRHLPGPEIIKDMIKGCFNAAVALVIASLLDTHFYDGRHTHAAFAILRQIRQAMGF